ncbi:quaternary amine ABC transporter ATP-binding protein [Roseivivax sediminis]|uniref:Quaternary amine transport ATP-binding protein n=1 Tax=Roseivivax sediminis TaxID=936889 RepID=A0A1I1VLU8_9RHOB|nr:betaine/proline/choline family ABC transporter ATP-binding protein [Roseivivax sediminis]SFD83881.1 glycine betaine/proline transport system ATP-binding protein [Roseivivax sediminis]
MTQDSPLADNAAAPPPDDDTPAETKLSCKGLWKVFGADEDRARRVIQGHDGVIGRDALEREGFAAAVRNADIDVRTGEIFVVMGLSGSGKSTLIRCLSLLLQPTSGELIFDGRDLLGCSEKELIDIRRHKMGMVFQHFALLPHLTVLGNVAFPLEIQGVSRFDAEERAHKMIELVGLGGRETDYPSGLSGGQQQRVGIARSLATDPDLWLLDEPFSALDPLIRREMQDEFLKLQRMLGKTIIFITHDFDEAIRLADRIAIMHSGDIVQIGTPEDLVIRPANDYVRDFTADVTRAKVLSARSIMRPADEGTSFAGDVAPVDRVTDFAARAIETEAPLAVRGRSGRLLGQVDREAVIRVLAEAE